MSLNDKLWKWLGVEEQGDFTTDLNLCFKWLVPKVRATYHTYNGKADWQIVLSNASETIYGRDNNPALALCLAIEKLIDAENKS